MRAGTDTALARVRVAAGVADSGAVSATVGGQVLMASVGSPAVGLYALLPAGTQPVALAVNGTALAAPAIAQEAPSFAWRLTSGFPRALDTIEPVRTVSVRPMSGTNTTGNSSPFAAWTVMRLTAPRAPPATAWPIWRRRCR